MSVAERSSTYKQKRPEGLLWIVWIKGILAVFAILLGVSMLTTGKLDLRDVLVRLGFDQIKGDATGLVINFVAPYVPVIQNDAVRNLAIGLIIFGVIKLLLVVELWRLEEWARKVAIGFFVLLLPVELLQAFHGPTVSKLLSSAVNALIIWYLWKVLPRDLIYLQRISRRMSKNAVSTETKTPT